MLGFKNLALKYKDSIFKDALYNYEKSQQKDYMNPPGFPDLDSDDIEMNYPDNDTIPEPPTPPAPDEI